jgi:PAS domain-containing protein
MLNMGPAGTEARGATVRATVIAVAAGSAFAGYGLAAGSMPVIAVLAISAAVCACAAVQVKKLQTANRLVRHEFTEAENRSRADRVAYARLQGSVDNISEGFLLWNDANRLAFFNPRTPSKYDMRVSAGMVFDTYVLAMYPMIDERTSGGAPESWLDQQRKWFATADGSHEILLKSGRWILLTERRTEDGGTVTNYTDITEQKLSQQLGELSEKRLAHAQKLTRIGIFEWDAAGWEMFWSDIMYEIVGLPNDSPPLVFLSICCWCTHPAGNS